MRRTARTLPILLAGSDFICSGFGSIQRFDNMFGPSQLNAEDIDDFLAIQRDWGVDGGLRTAARRRARSAAPAGRARSRATCTRHLGLADFTDDAGRARRRRRRLQGPAGTTDTLARAERARTPSGTSRHDGARRRLGPPRSAGYPGRGRSGCSTCSAPGSSGDYLQTAAIFDERCSVLSLVTDPNDYAGPGTGYDPTPARQAEIDGVRQQRSVDDLRAEQDDCRPSCLSSPTSAPRPPARPPARSSIGAVARGRPRDLADPLRA